MNRCTRVLVAAVLAVVLAPGAAAADQTATELEVVLASPPQPELPHAIVARLRTSDGSAVPNAEVRVYLDVSLFGGRSAFLGSAVTDTAGDARVAIRPDRPTYEVRARFAGSETLAASETVETITVPAGELRAVHEHGDPTLLSGVRRTAPRLAAVLVAAVWIALLVGSVWVLRRIHHHGSKAAFE